MATSQSPSISLGGFAEFASSVGSQRITAIHNVIANELGSYQPSHDFYRSIRRAITEGIADSSDTVRVQRAVEMCTSKQKAHFESLALGWVGWRRNKNLAIYAQSIPWHSSGLQVRVTPQFIYRAKRETYLVWPYFKQPLIQRDGIQAALRLMEITHTETGYRPAVLDIRRGRLHQVPNRPRRSGFDAWLTSEAAAFITLLESIKKAA